eukprot:SAG31_NODE_108_length_24741_cov_6.933041_3_plen_2073_part_00
MRPDAKQNAPVAATTEKDDDWDAALALFESVEQDLDSLDSMASTAEMEDGVTSTSSAVAANASSLHNPMAGQKSQVKQLNPKAKQRVSPVRRPPLRGKSVARKAGGLRSAQKKRRVANATVAHAEAAARGRSGSALLLARGPKIGAEITDSRDGKPLLTVANRGIAKGEKAAVAAAQGQHNGQQWCGFAIRSLEPYPPLLSHQRVARAMDVLAKGGDLQTATSLLGHDDVTTVRTMIAEWFVQFNLPVPAEYCNDNLVDRAGAGNTFANNEENPHRPVLSELAQRRLRERRTDMVSFAFIVESCGYHVSTGEPLVPPEFIGRRFPNGTELCSTFRRVVATEMLKGCENSGAKEEVEERLKEISAVATFQLMKAEDDGWMTADALHRSINARNIKPVVAVQIGVTNSSITEDAVDTRSVRISFSKVNDALRPFADKGKSTDADTYQHRLATGRVITDEGTPTVVVSVASSLLLQPCSPVATEIPSDVCLAVVCNGDRSARVETDSRSVNRDSVTASALRFSPPTAAARHLLGPAGLLQIAIRRGRGLCSTAPVTEACSRLLKAGTHPVPELMYAKSSGTRHLLWRLFCVCFQDLCPYLPSPGCCSVPELFGLALLATLDCEFQLPPWLENRVRATAERLHANDSAASLWPWRGWSRIQAPKADITRFELCNDSSSNVVMLRNTIRATLCTMPLASGDQAVLLRYLAALKPGSLWSKRLQPLPTLENNRPPVRTAKVEATLDKETRLAATDHHSRPSMLLFVQACMPFPPREPTQHSLNALSELIHRLSSSVNVRAVRQRTAGMNFDEELLRITSFVDSSQQKPANNASSKAAAVLGTGEASQAEGTPLTNSADGSEETTELQFACTGVNDNNLYSSAYDTMHLTSHEKAMLQVIQSVQQHLSTATNVSTNATDNRQRTTHVQYSSFTADSSKLTTLPAKVVLQQQRMPTVFEARTAFLQIFGCRHAFTLPQTGIPVAVTVAGTAENPCLVQRLSDGGDQGGVFQYLESGTLYNAAVKHLVDMFKNGREISCPPPVPGFWWLWGYSRDTKLRVAIRFECSSVDTNTCQRLAFFVGDESIKPFDATSLMVPANQPSTVPLTGRVKILLEQILYASPTPPQFTDPMQLLVDAEVEAAVQLSKVESKDDPVQDWEVLGPSSPLPRSFWRDLLVKLHTREQDVLTISACGRDGRRVRHAVQGMTEGTMLRVLYGLQMIYPTVLQRISELRFRVSPARSSLAFVHLTRSLSMLAFGSYQDGERFCCVSRPLVKIKSETVAEQSPMPTVVTRLWRHQTDSVNSVMAGIDLGKRGFADASAVGAGKTLSALATCCSIAEWAAKHGLRRQGFLVLVPTPSLMNEWLMQASLHTKNLHLLVQSANGEIKSKGRTCGGGRGGTVRCRDVTIDGSCVVITTLARCRDRPFVGQTGWDFVVIDECLSVQNDTALQTMEAWRQVSASRCGVLLLSATFFRSRFSKLFYMIRMLRSALPKTEPYLSALLREHITVHVPKNRRKWKLLFRSVHLSKDKLDAYQQLIVDGAAASREHRTLYTELKKFIRWQFDQDELIAAFAAETATLMAQGRRPLLFVNSDAELARVHAAVPNARQLHEDGDGPLIVTVHRGSHGLNLQDVCDAIVCRPQPGDLIEQMKGRVDRPGQKQGSLSLTVLYCAGTVEEAEAANVRLCGAFFRQFLDPLSRTFQEAAMAASVSAMQKLASTASSNHTQQKDAAPAACGQRKNRPGGTVASAFVLQLRSFETAEKQSTVEEVGDRNDASEDITSGLPLRSLPVCDGGASQMHAMSAVEENSPSISASQRKKFLKCKRGGLQQPFSAGGCFGPPAIKFATSAADGATPQPKRRNKIPLPPATGQASLIKISSLDAKVSVLPTPAELALRQSVSILNARTVAAAVAHLQNVDTQMAGLIATIGNPTGLLNQLGVGGSFKALTKSIVYQQLSIRVAATIFARLMKLCGGEDQFSPEKALTLSDDDLRNKCGFSYRKASYMKNLARKFIDGELKESELRKMTDAEVMKTVCNVKGIGEWSCHMFMMFQLGRQDVLPVGDLGIRTCIGPNKSSRLCTCA